MSPEVQRYIPIVASALGGVAWFSYLTWAIQKERLAKRPVLLAASILGAIPALYMALVWTRLIPERYLRLERPLLALPCAIAVAFVALLVTAVISAVELRRKLPPITPRKQPSPSPQDAASAPRS